MLTVDHRRKLGDSQQKRELDDAIASVHVALVTATLNTEPYAVVTDIATIHYAPGNYDPRPLMKPNAEAVVREAPRLSAIWQALTDAGYRPDVQVKSRREGGSYICDSKIVVRAPVLGVFSEETGDPVMKKVIQAAQARITEEATAIVEGMTERLAKAALQNEPHVVAAALPEIPYPSGNYNPYDFMQADMEKALRKDPRLSAIRRALSDAGYEPEVICSGQRTKDAARHGGSQRAYVCRGVLAVPTPELTLISPSRIRA